MNARTCVTIALVLLAQPAPGDEPPAVAKAGPRQGLTGLKRVEWKVGDVTREALVHVPEAPKGAPLVFVWHGHGGTMGQASRSFAIHERWPEAIVVYPQGLKTAGALTDPEGKLPGWQQRPGAEGDRDLKFFDAMFEGLSRDFQPDPGRVFATGHSNGGRMVYILWASRADRFAAFAPSASPATGLLGQMKPRPAVHIAGSDDKLVKFEVQRATMDRLLKINGCEIEGKRWGEFRGEVTLYDSPGKTPFVTAIYPGGHVFPKEAPEVIVKFFKSRGGE